MFRASSNSASPSIVRNKGSVSPREGFLRLASERIPIGTGDVGRGLLNNVTQESSRSYVSRLVFHRPRQAATAARAAHGAGAGFTGGAGGAGGGAEAGGHIG